MARSPVSRRLTRSQARLQSHESQTEMAKNPLIPPFPPFDDRFFLSEGLVNYHQLKQREIFQQRYISLGISAAPDIISVITANSLLNTIIDVESFPREVILEFYANFSGSAETRVFIRGIMYEFSPKLINSLYNTADVEPHAISECDRVALSKHVLAQYLTEGRSILWPSSLSPKLMPNYLAGLFRISCYNWLPTKITDEVSIECGKLLYMLDQMISFNFGKLVFDQVVRVARAPGHLRDILPFANLIFNVLNSQKRVPLESPEWAEVQLPAKVFEATFLKHGYNPPSNELSTSRNLSDELHTQAQELEKQGDELLRRAKRLRTMAAQLSGMYLTVIYLWSCYTRHSRLMIDFANQAGGEA